MRSTAALACVIVVAALALGVAAPRRSGTWNAQFTADVRAHVTAIAPDSPLAKAGVRAGDTIAFDRMPLAQRIAVNAPIAGVPVSIVVQRGHSSFLVTATPLKSPRSISIALVAAWLLTLLYAGMALLVAWRAVRGRERTLIVAMLCSLCVAFAAGSLPTVAPSSPAAALLTVCLHACVVVFLTAAILFVVTFPPRRTAALRYVTVIGVPVYIASATVYFINGVNAAFRVLPVHFSATSSIVMIVASFAMAAGVIDGLLSASAEYRVPARVAGSTLLVLAAVNTTFALGELLHAQVPEDILGLLQWASGFGVSYAVLRHRLLDLNLVISRAAIFSAVSLSLIAMFVIAEWALATMLERAIGPAFGESGKTALAAGVALCVGLSARGIHRVIEHRLNRVFFAKRYRALADLHRFALETDSATDHTALLELTLKALRRDLDAQYVALYTGTPASGYIAVGTTEAPSLPLRLDQNEETVLRLRRWGEPFVVENESHPLRGAFVSPMVLRGTLYGFAICGPKDDRASYLPDEKDAVAALIHRVGIAFEWLTRSLNDEVNQV